MFDEQDIRDKVDEVIQITLDHENAVKKLFKKDKESSGGLPEYNPIYKRTVELEEEMETHMEAKSFPEKLFKSKAPNENPEEFDYRKSIYQPVTKPFMNRAFRTINRIWNDSNYTIANWKDDEHKEYFETNYPKHKSIVAFFRSVVTKFKLRDPNGVIAIKPRVIPTIKDMDGNLFADQSKLIEPTAVLYESEQVINFEEDQYALIELREKSVVRHGNGEERTGRVFEFYDENRIWKISQVGKKIDWEFEYVVYYEHNLGKLPVSKLKGEPCESEDDYTVYESYFMPAIPNLNIALYNHNTLEMSITNDAFPQRWEYVDPCNYDGCEGGYITYDHEKGTKGKCPSCKGTGHTERHSPLGVKQVYVGDRLTPGAEGLAMPPAGYIAPDTATLEFRHTKYLKDVEQAFAFLNIDVSNSNVKPGEETATGKKIDREELFSFLLLISNELFDLLDQSIDVIGKMRYGTFEGPEITKPVDFSIRSNEELIQEMVEAKAAFVPDIIIQKQLKEYALNRFNTSHEVTKFLDIVFKVDRLLTLTQQDIVLQKNIGAVINWEVILHTSIYTFLEQALVEDPKFLELEFQEQKTKLEQMAKDKEAEIKKASPAPTLDKILANANSQGNNTEKVPAA
jgi:hypothetical protein